MENKNIYVPAAILAGAVIIAGAILYNGNPEKFSSRGTANVGSVVQNNGSTVEFAIGENDHIRGNPKAEITIVEFSDLECPFCRSFHPTVSQALQEYDGQIRWVYKHFPLESIHPQAIPAAEASECVWEQKGDEAFWTFTDQVFANQERIGSSLYREIAQDLGADLFQFNTCVSQRKYKEKVQADYQQGVEAGVTGTPGSFVNGVPVRGAIPYAQLKSIIESQF